MSNQRLRLWIRGISGRILRGLLAYLRLFLAGCVSYSGRLRDVVAQAGAADATSNCEINCKYIY